MPILKKRRLRGKSVIDYRLLIEFNGSGALSDAGTLSGTVGEMNVVIKDGTINADGTFAAQTTPAWGDQYLIDSEARANIAGLVGLFEFNSGDNDEVVRGLSKDATLGATPENNFEAALHSDSAGVSVQDQGDSAVAILPALSASTDYKYAFVLASSYQYYLLHDTAWELAWIKSITSESNLYAAISNYDNDFVEDDTYVASTSLDDSSFLTVDITSPAEGQTFTHDADCFIVLKDMTLPTYGFIRVRVRGVDSSNYWELEIDSSGNWTYKKYTPNSTTSANGSGLTGTFTLKGKLSGNDHNWYYNDSEIIDITDADNATGTAGEIEQYGFDTLGTELVANGDFANWTADDPDDWTVVGESGNLEISEVGASELNGGVGTGSCNWFSDAAAFAPEIRQTLAMTSGNLYRVSLVLGTNGSMSGNMRVRINSNGVGDEIIDFATQSGTVNSDIEQETIAKDLRIFFNNAIGDATVQSVSAKETSNKEVNIGQLLVAAITPASSVISVLNQVANG